MSHLLPLLLFLLLPAWGCSREEPQKLCAHSFIRALVRVCGGPRWALPEGKRGASGDRAERLEPRSDIQRTQRWRRALSPAKHCCSNGCTKQDLMAFCPY